MNLPEPAFVHRTKDIAGLPSGVLPGNRATLIATVRNFSLLNTTNPVEVSFFRGDPDAGGIPIVGVNGETSVLTDDVLLPRGRSSASMEWDIPASIDFRTLRIYATLALTGFDIGPGEIHSNNSKGWIDLVETMPAPNKSLLLLSGLLTVGLLRNSIGWFSSLITATVFANR